MSTYDADVLVLGDGPMGLTAALYLARNGLGVRVLGEDQTPMHGALLRNQPGVPDMPGHEFMRILREQATDAGAHVHPTHARSLQCIGDVFQLTSTPQFDTFCGRYVVLATGRNRHMAEVLGVDMTAEGNARIDIHGRTNCEKVYAGGNLARGLTQCAVSMGDGTAVALDILSREAGEPVRDYTPMPAISPVEGIPQRNGT